MTKPIIYIVVKCPVNYNAKQKQPGCKKGTKPIRSNNGYKQPKTLIQGQRKQFHIGPAKYKQHAKH